MLRDISLKKVYRCGRRTGKTETMVVESIYQTNVHDEFVFLFVAPYENQIRLIFNRINELISASPLVKNKVVSNTKNPFEIKFNNNSRIVGFTTSASSGNGGASIRGQRANFIAADEMDYMGDAEWENVSMLAAERADIRIVCSSTPTGRRSYFYNICTNKNIGFSEHFHPSYHNPNWNEDMEAQFRSELTADAYVKEVEAGFGEQLTGVFNKECLDKAIRMDNYAYNELTKADLVRIEKAGMEYPLMYLPINGRFKPNLFRCFGIDWDKYQASSSIVIMDYDTNIDKFRIIKRIEVPKVEYSYDKAVSMVIELNEIYNPSWIFVDKGAGEYQIERLHIYGERHPESGLKNKVVGWQFSNKIEVPDPINKTVSKEPLKPFMVNQLALAFERNRIIMSPYDDILYKQLIDYSVERISQNGTPVYTSINEHFVDATGLAYLAFVLNFPEITKGIQMVQNTNKIFHVNNVFQNRLASMDLESMAESARRRNPWFKNVDMDDLPGDRPEFFKVPLNAKVESTKFTGLGWGNRAMSGRANTRRMW